MIRQIALFAGLFAVACAPGPEPDTPPESAQSETRQSEIAGAAGPERPNIVLVLFEDMSPRVGAFGDDLARTPFFDRIASEGVRYPNTFTAAGVCAPSRAALITGRYAPSIGAQHMRTHSVAGLPPGGPQNYYAVPPEEVKAFPELLRAAGYYVTNNAKTDYQFGEPVSIWDESSNEADWTGREAGQPFFSMITLMQSHESYLWPTDREPRNRIEALVQGRNAAELSYDFERTDPALVEVAPYLPDTPEVRADIARQYDNITLADQRLGEIIARLEADGVLADTILIVSTDHGDGLPRAKRSLYDSGLQVPMAIRFPGGEGAGSIDAELVSFIDLAPTILSWAGVEAPDWMHGFDFAGPDQDAERQYIFATQDRIDNRIYQRRAVRDDRFKLIVNYRLQDPYFEHVPFRDSLPTMEALWVGLEAGTLPEAAERLFEPLPQFQLYDTLSDPHEVTNLADDPAYAETLARLSAALDERLAVINGPDVFESEAAMVAAFWPGGEQPVTAAPAFVSEGAALTLSPQTPGASLVWRCAGEEGWRLYTGPVQPSCGRVEAASQRYGWMRSAVVEVDR